MGKNKNSLQRAMDTMQNVVNCDLSTDEFCNKFRYCIGCPFDTSGTDRLKAMQRVLRELRELIKDEPGDSYD